MSEKTSDDDRLLLALRDALRAEAGDALADARWDALARGELSEEEQAELNEFAEQDPYLAGAPELFAPLGAAHEERFLAAIRGELAAPVEKAEAPAEKVEAPAEKVVSLDARRRSRGGWVAGVATALALAAAVTLWVATRPESGDALPAYSLIVSGGEREVRADEPRAAALGPGAPVTLTLRPRAPTTGAISARAFLVQGATEIALEASVEVSEDGAVRMVGQVPEGAKLAAGDAEIVAAVGPPGELGAAKSLAELSRRGGALRWSRGRVEWRAQAP